MHNLTEQDRYRFWNLINVVSENICWEWRTYPSDSKYARFSLDRKQIKKTYLSHRVAFYFATGIDPGQLMVCHSCDNPLCCNPKHLWLGTCKDNVQDARAKGRMKTPGAKLNEKQVKEIKILINDGMSNVKIAIIYNVTHSNISAIKRNLSWTNIKI